MRNDTCDIHSALCELYERTSHTLSQEELEWFSGAIKQAEIVATSLQGAISNAAFLIEQESMASVKHHMPDLLWSTMHQLDAIRGLLHVGGSAAYRLRHPEQFEKKDSKPTAEIEQLRKQV